MTRRMLILVMLIPLIGISVCYADPIRIGLSLGLTGEYAPLANMQERAFRLWELQTNESGGVLGRKVQITIYDDQSNKETAQQLYLRMIKEDKMDLLFPPYSSGLTAAILPITEKFGYPMLASGASADSIWRQGYRYIFGVYSSASRYTLGFVEMALAYNFTKLAIISADDPFSISLAKGTEKWAGRLGLEVTLRQTFQKGSTQLEPIARSVKNSGAHALVMCGHFDESVNMRKALKHIKWYPQAYYASVGPVLQSYYDHLAVDAENTFSSTQWMYYDKLLYSDKLPFPGGKGFFQSFTAAYDVEPSYQAAAAYASGVLLISAIEKTGNLNREKIRDTMASMDVVTLLGRYGVDRTGMQIRHFALIIQWIDGRKQVIWPSELSTAAPQFP